MRTTNRQIVVNEGGEVLSLHSATLGGETVPKRILLAPWGNVESSNGSFVVDEESARLAVQAFEEHGTDLPIDYEHQTLGGVYASPSGQAPAAGWIKRIFAESGVGLLAEIDRQAGLPVDRSGQATTGRQGISLPFAGCDHPQNRPQAGRHSLRRPDQQARNRGDAAHRQPSGRRGYRRGLRG